MNNAQRKRRRQWTLLVLMICIALGIVTSIMYQVTGGNLPMTDHDRQVVINGLDAWLKNLTSR